jgi:hypothetical protein
MAKPELEAAAKELGLTIDAIFIPWSQSRNKGEKQPSLNWSVTLRRNGREVLTTDYGAGLGHCPAYKDKRHGIPGVMTVDRDKAVRYECENGRTAGRVSSCGRILPDTCNVLYGLISDADVLDAGGFEDWAANYGYDTDSRKAEDLYRQCLETALKLRNHLGEAGLEKLRQASEDY